MLGGSNNVANAVLSAGGSVTVSGELNSAGPVGLTSGGSIDTASITTANGGGITFENGGTLTIGGTILADGPVTQITSGGVNLNANIRTTSDVVSFTGPVTFGGGPREISTSVGGGGDIIFNNSVNGGGNDVTLDAGTEGDIIFNGGVNNFGSLNLSNVNNLALLGGFTGTGLIQAAGAGSTTLGGVIITNGPQGVSITTNGTVTVTGQISTNDNPVTFNASDWDFGGSTIDAGTQSITIAHVTNGVINIGSQLDTADLAALVAAQLYIGSVENTGIINVDGSADFAPTTPNVTLRATKTGGKITQSNPDAIVGSPPNLLTLLADSGIGAPFAPVRFTGTNVSALNTTEGDLVLQFTSRDAVLLEPFRNEVPDRIVDVSHLNGSITTLASVSSQGELALRAASTGATARINIGASGLVARDDITVQAANTIDIASGRGVESTTGTVTFVSGGSALGATTASVGGIRIGGPVVAPGAVKVSAANGSITTTAAVSTGSTLSMMAASTGAPADVKIGAAGLRAEEDITLKAAQDIAIESGQGVRSATANVIFSSGGAALGAKAATSGSIMVDAPVSAAQAVAFGAANGSIATTEAITAGTALSMTAASTGAAAHINIGAAGLEATDDISLKAAQNITIANGQGVHSSAGNVTFISGGAALGATTATRGSITIDGPVSAAISAAFSAANGDITTTAPVAAGTTLSMTTASTGAPANISVGAGGLAASGDLMLQAAQHITIASGQGVQSSTGNVTMASGDTTLGATAGTIGAIRIDGPVNAANAAQFSTMNGDIATTAAISAGTTLEMTANSRGATAQIHVGAGGLVAQDAVTLRSADGITVEDGKGVASSNADVTFLAGNASGMLLEYLKPLTPALAQGTGSDSAVTINGPVHAAGHVTILSTGPVAQSESNVAGLQAGGVLTVATFNDNGAPISLRNSLLTGDGVCAEAIGSGNCAGTLVIGTLFADGRSSDFAAADIDYQGIGAVTVQAVATAADARVASTSMVLPSSNLYAKNASFWATGGDLDLSAQIANRNINKGDSGGSLNLYALGNVNVNAPPDVEAAGVTIGRRASVDSSGSVTAEPFGHDLTLAASGDINITGSIYMASDRDLSLRADASDAEVGLTPGAPALGDGAGSVRITTQPASYYGSNGTVFPLEVMARDIVVGRQQGAQIYPVQNLEISTTLPGLPADGTGQRADALLSASGNLKVYFRGDLTITAGSTQAVTTAATQKLESTAVAAMEGTDVLIRGVGANEFGSLPQNTSSILLSAGSAMADNGEGGDAFAAADAAIIASRTKTIDVGGDMWLRGGNTLRRRNADVTQLNLVSAQAFLDPATMNITTGGSIVLIAGLGVNATAKIVNSGDVKFTIGGISPVTYVNPLTEEEKTVAQGGLLLVGGPGSGIFDAFDNPTGLKAPPIEANFYRGGDLNSIISGDRNMAAAYVKSGPTRNFDDLLSYILFAANEETRVTRVRVGTSSSDDANLPSCN
ncbi:MAG: hypothetical protein A3G25_14950 [Betaproteobacteria bacterium RIFCSPLOWO2_12_FULL_63_13]|nr:MAG: hypothetical protein A3G25_14950 [Betaproteobacteria bacterium RIFCSPLOWO2_12_FULL_63_13]